MWGDCWGLAGTMFGLGGRGTFDYYGVVRLRGRGGQGVAGWAGGLGPWGLGLGEGLVGGIVGLGVGVGVARGHKVWICVGLGGILHLINKWASSVACCLVRERASALLA